MIKQIKLKVFITRHALQEMSKGVFQVKIKGCELTSEKYMNICAKPTDKGKHVVVKDRFPNIIVVVYNSLTTVISKLIKKGIKNSSDYNSYWIHNIKIHRL